MHRYLTHYFIYLWSMGNKFLIFISNSRDLYTSIIFYRSLVTVTNIVGWLEISLLGISLYSCAGTISIFTSVNLILSFGFFIKQKHLNINTFACHGSRNFPKFGGGGGG